MTVSRDSMDGRGETVVDGSRAVGNRAVDIDAEVERAMSGLGLLAAGANVIMQLARPAVGYGVYESKVETGRLDRHPVKRTRTTLTYLAVASLATDEEKKLYRRAVNGSHKHVRSDENSAVEYNAFDPELQLWVAACLYRGFEDVYTILYGDLDPVTQDAFYQRSATFGTTLQMRRDMWPADRDAFEVYWNENLDKVAIDDTIREHLYGIASATFTPKLLHPVVGPLNRFVTTGFLPQTFRDEMRLPWSARRQRNFDRSMRVAALVNRFSPKILRMFPYNFYLWDLRRRIAKGIPLV